MLKPCDTTYEGVTVRLFPIVPDTYKLSRAGRAYADAWITTRVIAPMMLAMPCAKVSAQTCHDTDNMAMFCVCGADDVLIGQINALTGRTFATVTDAWLLHVTELDGSMFRKPGEPY